MDQFPPNSKSARVQNEPKAIKRVTSAEAVRRKKGLGRRFRETMFVGADARSTWDYVVIDVIVPEARDLLYNAFDAAVQRLVYGDSRPRNRGPVSNYSNVGHVDYSARSRITNPSGRPSQPRMLSRRSRARGSFDDIVIATRSEAEEVIDRMFDILSQDGQVSVSHLLDLTGIESTHTDIKWGWTQLRGAKAVKLRQGGFLLDLPEPEPFV
jgi:hypothetical protein